MPEFCHLHCHTHYSLLDGAARIGTLVDRAAELGMPALAITDHGNLYGVPEFYGACRERGVQPIIGCEFYVSPDMAGRQDRTRYHQVLLARNDEGYRNLIHLSSSSYVDGYYYRPRIDRAALQKHHAGLIATTCCLQGEVPQAILKRGEEEGLRVFLEYLELFGENYYVELQDHGIEDQRRVNALLVRWADKYGVKVIATNDVHYVNQADAEAQDVLLCLQTGRDLRDPTRMRFENDQFFLKSLDEMRAAFAPAVGAGVLANDFALDAALDNTREIADRCLFEMPETGPLMPHFPIPEPFVSADAYLRHLTYEGARRRWDPLGDDVAGRIDYELGVIRDTGFAGYFLIVSDFTTAARRLGVTVGPGRGSAAGSAVAYCLGITNIDPIRYNLLFERFLNPERVSMPDIDIDFDDRGRSKVIDYVVEKYGRESVCQIVTFGTMGARSVIRDVARVMGIPLSEADRIAKLIPDGPASKLASARKEVREFADLWNSPDPQIGKLMRFAEVLEGSARHTGVHAAGVIIAPGRVADYVPVAVQKGRGGDGDVVTTQYDGKWIEGYGLLKMDFLGLKTLTIMDDACALIRETHGVEIDLNAIPLDDQATFQLFQRGDTVAVFQFESDGMREYLRQLRPTSLDDLIAMNALYRPGPMELIPQYIKRKNGEEPIEQLHPLVEDLLAPTYGLPVYQEQVMQMAQVLAGFSLGRADLLRRAMGKKDHAKMAKEKSAFVSGAAEREIDEEYANDIWRIIEKFAGYGFNKSHSAAYGLVAYQTAYLKAHYPAAYMAATLTSEMHDQKKLAVALEATRAAGVEIEPPCINRSQAHFAVDNGRIRFGLAAIKGVGQAAIEAIEVAREAAGGAFDDLAHLCRDLDLRAVGRKTIETLARAGALDHFGGHRAQLVAGVESAWGLAQQRQADLAMGQSSLFGDGASGAAGGGRFALPTVEPWTRAESLRNERELMGFYVSGHPLDDYAAERRAFATLSLGDADGVQPERDYAVIGIVTAIQRRTSRNGKPLAFVAIEDETSQAEVLLFSQTYEKYAGAVSVDDVILIRGRIETAGAVRVIAREIIPMWRVREQLVKSIVLRLDSETTEPARLEELATLCTANKGDKKLFFEVTTPHLPKTVRLHARTAVVDLSPDLMHGLGRLFGRDAVILEGGSD